jgi:hypothetical protein
MSDSMVYLASEALEECITIPAMVFVLCKTGEKIVIIDPGLPSTCTPRGKWSPSVSFS